MAGWSYDAAGNLLSDGTATSTYDALSRLTSQGGTGYAYNGDGVLVGQVSGTNTISYTQDLAALLSQVLSDGNASYVYGTGAERLRALGGPWYIGDALGSVRSTLDDAGAAVATASYDPWRVPQSSMIAPFGFTGELQDGQGLTYLRARWYTAGSGQFTSRDPFAGIPERPYSKHYYQCAYSNPVLFTDPSGTFVRDIIYGWGIVAAIKPQLLAIAQAHATSSPELANQGLNGNMLATMMAAIVATESNILEFSGRRRLGDIEHFITRNNPSTGIANMRMLWTIDVLNSRCDFIYTYWQAGRNGERYDSDDRWEVRHIYRGIEFDYWSMTRSPQDFAFTMNRIVLGLDLLAASLKEGAQRLSAAGFHLSVFNVTSVNFITPTGGWPGIKPEGMPTVGYLDRMANKDGTDFGATFGGVNYVRNFARAAAVLGIAPPTSLPLYATSVHPIDIKWNPKMDRTEADWAKQHADKVPG